MDRQRHHRRRGRGLGPRHRRRPGQGLPRREGHARLRRTRHRRQGLAPGGLAGRHHAHRRPGAAEANRLPGANSFKDAGRVLAGTRNAVAWGALGHATAAYEAALAYTEAAHPVRQAAGELPDRAGPAGQDARRGLLDAAVLPAAGPPEEQGKLTDTIAALAKMNNTRKARQVIAEARDLLGGNGILLDYHVMRHMADIEAHPHLRGHRDHPDPDRRTRHHRCRRLLLLTDPRRPVAGIARQPDVSDARRR